MDVTNAVTDENGTLRCNICRSDDIRAYEPEITREGWTTTVPGGLQCGNCGRLLRPPTGSGGD